MTGSSKRERILTYKIVPERIRDRFDRVFSPFNGSNTVGNSPDFWFLAILIVALACLYPFFTNPFRILNMSTILIFAFLALSLTIIWGYTGIFSFGQTAFFGLGGYTYGVIGINLLEITGGTNLALLVGITLPTILAAFLGYFMFYGRVSGVYVAIITLATTLILQLSFARTAGQQFTIGDAHLGGYDGMTSIPSMTLGIESFSLSLGYVGMYYFIILLFIGLFLGLRYLVNSDYGRVLIAIRDDEHRTEMLGYDVRKIKLHIFILSGAIGGLGGALFASVQNFISPPVMGLIAAALPVIWITIGGRTTILGSIVGAIGLQLLESELAAIGDQIAVIALGVILVVVILFFPAGLIVWFEKKRKTIAESDTPET